MREIRQEGRLASVLSITGGKSAGDARMPSRKKNYLWKR
jgi:hypothetical protein